MANRFTIYFGWSPCTPENKAALLQASLKRAGTRNSLLNNKKYINLFTSSELTQLIETHRPVKAYRETASKYLQRCDRYDLAMAKRLLPHFNTVDKSITLVTAFNRLASSSMVTKLLNYPGIERILLHSSDSALLQALLQTKAGLSLLLSSEPWAKRASSEVLAFTTYAYYKNYRMNALEQEQRMFSQTLTAGCERLGEGSISFRLAMTTKANFQYIIEKIEPDNRNDIFIKQLDLQLHEVASLCDQYQADVDTTTAFLDKYFAVMQTYPTETPCDIVCRHRDSAYSLLHSPVIIQYLKTKEPGITWPFVMSVLSLFEEGPVSNDAILDNVMNALISGNQQEALLAEVLNHTADEQDGMLRYPIALSYLVKKYPDKLTAAAIQIEDNRLKAPALLQSVVEHNPQLLANLDNHSLTTIAVCVASTTWLASFLKALNQLGNSLLSLMKAESPQGFENTQRIFQQQALVSTLSNQEIAETILPHQKNLLVVAKQSFEVANLLMSYRYKELSNLDKMELLIAYQQQPEHYAILHSIMQNNSDSLYQLAMQDAEVAELLLSEQGALLIANEHWANAAIEILARQHKRLDDHDEEVPQALPMPSIKPLPSVEKAEPKAKKWLTMITDVNQFKQLCAADQVKQLQTFANNDSYRQFINEHIEEINIDLAQKLLNDKQACVHLMNGCSLLNGWFTQDNQPLLRYQDRLRLAIKHQLLQAASPCLLPTILYPTGESGRSFKDLEQQFLRLLANEIEQNPEKIVTAIIANRDNRELVIQLYQALEQCGYSISKLLNTRHVFKSNDVYKQLTKKLFNTVDNQWLLAEMGADIFKVVEINHILKSEIIHSLPKNSAGMELDLNKLLQATIDNSSIAEALVKSSSPLQQSICKYVFMVSTPLTDAVLVAFGQKVISKASAIANNIGGKQGQAFIDNPQLQNRLLNLCKDNPDVAAELARIAKPLSLVLPVLGCNKRAERIREQMGYQALTHLSMIILDSPEGQKAMTEASMGFIFSAAANSEQTATRLLKNSYARQWLLADKHHIEERFQLLNNASLSIKTDGDLIALKKALGAKLNDMQRRKILEQQAKEEQLIDNELRPLIQANKAEQVEHKIKDNSFKQAVSYTVILELIKQQTSPDIVYALAFYSPSIASMALEQHYFSAVQIASLLLYHIKHIDDSLLYVVADARCQRIDFDSQDLLEPWSLLSIAEDKEARTLLLRSSILQQALADLIKQKAALNPPRIPKDELILIVPKQHKAFDESMPQSLANPLVTELPSKAPSLPMAPPPPPPPPPAFKPIANKPLVIKKNEKPVVQMLTPAQMIEATKLDREAKKNEELTKIRQQLEASGELNGLTEIQIEEKVSFTLVANNEAKQRQLRQAAKDIAIKPVFELKGSSQPIIKKIGVPIPKESIIKGIPDVISSEFAAKIYKGIKPRGNDSCSALDRKALQEALKPAIESLYQLNKYRFEPKNVADAELLKNDIEAILLDVGVSQLRQAMPDPMRLAANQDSICQQIKSLDDGKLLRGVNGLVERFHVAMVEHVIMERDKNRASARKANAILQKKVPALPVNDSNMQEPVDLFAEIRQGRLLKKTENNLSNAKEPIMIKVDQRCSLPKPKAFFLQRDVPFIPGLSNTVIDFFADEFIKLFSKPVHPSGQLADQQQLEARLKNDIKTALKGQFASLPAIAITLDQKKDELTLSQEIYTRLKLLLTFDFLVPNGASDDMLHLKSIVYGRDGTNPDSLLLTYSKIFAHSWRSYQQILAEKIPVQEQNGNCSSNDYFCTI